VFCDDVRVVDKKERHGGVAIVMLEKLNCILSKRVTRPVYI
jgi:hypothetical protein